MGAKSPRSGHELTRDETSKGGKKSKRGPSIKTQVKNLLEGELPQQIIDYVAKNEKAFHIISKEHGAKAVAQAILARALEGDTQLLKWIGEQLDGKAKESVEHSGDLPAGVTIILPPRDKR